MSRRPALDPSDHPTLEPGADDLAAPADADAARTASVDLAALPIAGLTRRRMAIIAAAMLAAWIVVAFARQVSDATAAA
jgi:hypothetical protein